MIRTSRRVKGYLERCRSEATFPFPNYMRQHSCIFIHIPKNAGTSIRSLLGAPRLGRQHLPWWVFKQASAKKFKNYFKFAFVRNPIDRAISGYEYLCDGGNGLDDHEASREINDFLSFDDFVDRGLQEGGFLDHVIFGSQAEYVCDYKGELKIDFLGRVENMSVDAVYAMSKIGVSSPIPSANRSSNFCRRTEIQPRTLDSLKNIYSKDFSLLSKVTQR